MSIGRNKCILIILKKKNVSNLRAKVALKLWWSYNFKFSRSLSLFTGAWKKQFEAVICLQRKTHNNNIWMNTEWTARWIIRMLCKSKRKSLLSKTNIGLLRYWCCCCWRAIETKSENQPKKKTQNTAECVHVNETTRWIYICECEPANSIQTHSYWSWPAAECC